MQSYRVWSPVVLFGSVLALAQAADQELLQPWPYGPYDKNIEIKRSVQPLSAKALASAEVPSADKVLAEAKAKASAENKTIFLHFGASWCGWCKRLDAFLDRPDIKPVFEKYFIPVKLVVQENEKNKALENAGADALLQKLDGGHAGLPYSAFLDSQGALIVNSKRDGQNIGYPGEPQEIDWFLQMMRKAAPKMSEDDLKTIETALRRPVINALSPTDAAPFAANLANDECERLYKRRPFVANQHPAVLGNGEYHWGGLDEALPGGYSALVTFGQDGSHPKVEVYFSTDQLIPVR